MLKDLVKLAFQTMMKIDKLATFEIDSLIKISVARGIAYITALSL